MFKVNGTTRIFGIFGDPVSHSLSPGMQNLAIQTAGLDAIYVPFQVTVEQLASAVEGIRALKLGGVNVTLPHKRNIVPLLDRIDQGAALIGAVNTVINRGGELTGYNTDGTGLLCSLREDVGFIPQGKNVLVLGAGGASRAAVVSLLQAGASHIFIANRDQMRAECLAEELAPFFPDQYIEGRGLDCDAYLDNLSRADLVINTTSIGLQGEELSFCPLTKIKASASVYDVVYSVVETPFVCAARDCGLNAADGIGMLAGQGERAFQLWFGQLPQKGLMKNYLQRLHHINYS